MKFLCFDTETEPIGPLSVDLPPFVVGGALWGDTEQARHEWEYKYTPDEGTILEWIRQAQAQGRTIVGHNLAFDFGVLHFRMSFLKQVKIWDTGIQDILHRLETDDCGRSKPGPPRMRKLTELGNKRIEGKGTVQLSFRVGKELTEEQLEYLQDDVRVTASVFMRQFLQQRYSANQNSLQVRSIIALQRLTRNGLRVDRSAISRQRIAYTKLKRQSIKSLRGAGIYRPAYTGKKGGKYKASINTKAMKEHVLGLCEKHDIKPQYTDKGNLKTDRTTLKGMPKDSIIDNYLQYKGAEKVLSTFLDAWDNERARIHPRYRSPMRTGRTSSHGPNLQQIPSKGGLKEVFIAEEGMGLYEIDYNQLELCCIAELTQKKMREKINKGDDLHRYLASVYLNKPEEEVTDDERQLAKQANFGLPGGMGVATFRQTVRSAGMEDPGDRRARELKNAWLEAYPEMVEWLKDHSGLPKEINMVAAGKVEGNDRVWLEIQQILRDHRTRGLKIPNSVMQKAYKQKGDFIVERYASMRDVLVKGRRRRPVSYTEERNTKFQGLAADLTKTALCEIIEVEDIVLHGFVHDSFIFSAKHEKAVMEVVEGMLNAARMYLPSVIVGVEVLGPGKDWADAKQQPERNFYTKEFEK